MIDYPHLRKWLPGILFLAAQLANTIYELTRDERTFSWAPHTVQIFYKITAFKDGRPLDKEAVEARYGIAESYWEAHAAGNITRIVRAVENNHNEHPDSVLIDYSRNGGEQQVYRWLPNPR